MHTETFLHEVPDEVADVEPRVAQRVPVVVEHVQPVAVDQNLVGIKVAMNTGGLDGIDRRRPLAARSENILKRTAKLRQLFGNDQQPLV
jgi:hypothetical protein